VIFSVRDSLRRATTRVRDPDRVLALRRHRKGEPEWSEPA